MQHNMQGVEIERKWLLEGEIPADLEVVETCEILQGYLSISPEVRVRVRKYEGNNCKFRLAIKGDGTITRDEVQYCITESEYKQLVDIGGLKECQLIHKDYAKYKYGELFIEISTVDAESVSNFKYIEIEFNSEEEAEAFEAPTWFGKEVTYDKRYKMKNYWTTTRLGED